jgi:hypothetical protein
MMPNNNNNPFNAIRSSNRIDFAKYLNGPYHSYNLSNDRLSNNAQNEDSYSPEEIR